jgi:hypothetical protein
MDYSALLATPAALDLIQAAGVDQLRERNAVLVNAGAAAVSRALGQEPPDEGPLSMVTFEPARMSMDIAGCLALRARIAEELRAEVVVTVARGRTVMRLSAQAYNREDEYRRLAAYLATI